MGPSKGKWQDVHAISTYKHKAEHTNEAKERRVNRVKIPHIPIDRYDQTNQGISH